MQKLVLQVLLNVLPANTRHELLTDGRRLAKINIIGPARVYRGFDAHK